MSVKIAEISDIPAALPIAEEGGNREKLLREAAGENDWENENLSNETEDVELEELAETPRSSKKKLFFAFVLCVFGFILLVLVMSWFFRLGAFATANPQPVDRTKQTNSSDPAPVTEEEKLKMALNLVAEKNPNASNSDASNTNETVAGNTSVNIPPPGVMDLAEPVIVPDPLVQTNRTTVNAPLTSAGMESSKTPISSVSNSVQSSKNNERTNETVVQQARENNIPPLGRSLFFGIERKETAVLNTVSGAKKQTVANAETINFTDQPKPSIPFGTLLPIRFLGAVYTLRASGGLVRMELTRAVSGKNYSYAAGTVLVGSLRGSEYKRAFITVHGLIDPQTGGLVKLTGEVLGGDGASGITGRRRQIKSTWSRIFEGLRDAGAVAVGTLGSGRSGGSVIISDGASKVSGEISGLIANSRNSNEFVEVGAGTTAFVLITELPDEISNSDSLLQNSESSTGLTTSELADLFSEGNKDKIRAALPRMTPQFRLLAEKYLAMEGK